MLEDTQIVVLQNERMGCHKPNTCFDSTKSDRKYAESPGEKM